MRIDLHTHSNRSDGTDAPAVLMEHAVTAGLDVIALTDHDSTEGWAEAQAAADRLGLRLVHGIEVSTRLLGKSVHLLGYDFDPSDAALTAELARIIDGRNSRLPTTLARLRELGIDITAEDVRSHAREAAAMGRPHVADALVAAGVVLNREEAFDRFLSPGRPAYVDRYAAELHAAIELVKNAGGRTVLAHPWARGSDKVLTPETVAELAGAGLDGIEVDHNDHPAQVRDTLRALATQLDLVITGSSDHHGTGKIGFDLGCNLTAPKQFERLLG